MQAMEQNIKDKIVLVTGASRGIGYATARAAAAAGAHVIAVARTVGGLEELADEIDSAAAGGVTLVPLDITDDAGLQRMCAAIFERWARLDLWVHTAIHSPPLTPAHQVQMKDLDKGIAISIKAFQRLVCMIDPLLRLSQDGCAVILTEEIVGKPYYASLGAAKAAQAAIAESWRAENVRNGPQVILHTPSNAPTAHRSRAFPGEDRTALPDLSEISHALLTRAFS